MLICCQLNCHLLRVVLLCSKDISSLCQLHYELYVILEAGVVQKRIASEIDCGIDINLTIVDIDEADQLFGLICYHELNKFVRNIDEMICV
jgi:hypothetical protein